MTLDFIPAQVIPDKCIQKLAVSAPKFRVWIFCVKRCEDTSLCLYKQFRGATNIISSQHTCDIGIQLMNIYILNGMPICPYYIMGSKVWRWCIQSQAFPRHQTPILPSDNHQMGMDRPPPPALRQLLLEDLKGMGTLDTPLSCATGDKRRTAITRLCCFLQDALLGWNCMAQSFLTTEPNHRSVEVRMVPVPIANQFYHPWHYRRQG